MSAKLLTKPLREQLLRNGQAQQAAKSRGDRIDFKPVVKLFTRGVWPKPSKICTSD